MSELINIYCDESCHLEKDGQKVMVLGSLWCPKAKVIKASQRLKDIRAAHKINPFLEIKWTKVSGSKVQFYLDILDYFFDNDDLHFRALIIPDKSKLDHAARRQTHDEWYYKMYFDLLKVIIDPKNRYHIYLDIKDTRGRARVAKLHEVLANEHYDFSREIIESIQLVRSHDVQLVQLADLLIGAISYVNRHLTHNAGKVAVVRRMQERSKYDLSRTTLLREDKVNIFRWHATESSQ